jgi:ubiquinol-cytochrome c reductase iron-sulfur subunit
MGCSTQYKEHQPYKKIFYCPCHGSNFDLAGRVLKGSPAPRNLEVPPYKFIDENTILIGKHQKS